MFDKNPETIGWVSYLWVFALATFGGFVAYLKKIKNGKKWNWVDFLIEIVTAAFAGLTTFFLCQWVGMDQMGTAALTGISGHFSSKAITLFGNILDKFLGRMAK